MPKDISQYIDFSGEGRLPSRSIKSLLDKPCTVLGWQFLESHFSDGNPSGRYVQLRVELDAGIFIVNTGSAIVMSQLEQIRKAKEDAGESVMDFTCMVKRCGKGVKMYPLDWERKDVSAQERA